MTPAEFKRKRSSLGFTQETLADALDLRANTVSRYETGGLPVPRTVEYSLLHLENEMKKTGGFFVEGAIKKYDDPQQVMVEWFKFEGRECPQDFGVVFFKGWESFTPEDKLAAIIDAKRVLDRSLGGEN